MNLYRQTHEDFFFATAFLRHSYGLDIACADNNKVVPELLPEFLNEGEIQDFTIAYMAGEEL